MKLASQKIGAEGQIDVDLLQGQLVVVATENTAGVKLKIEGDIDLMYYAQKGADQFNSPMVKALFGLVESTIKVLP